jgi:RNA polymerase sigma-70 factor (family 1)
MTLDFDLCWKKIRKDDEQTLERVYKAAFRPLVIYASEITGQSQLGEEVVQDVLLKIWQNRSELSIKGSFKAYLFQSVHNHALNTLRQQKTIKESVNQLGSEKTWKFISDTYNIDDNLIDKLFSDETEAILNKIIKKLPEQCQKVFLLSRHDSLNNAEIAAKLEISENTVKAHIYRALEKITIALGKERL